MGCEVDQTVLEIKVSRDQFLKACSNREVKGKNLERGVALPYVTVELGEETNYRARTKDDPKTEFRRFVRCYVWATDTEEKRDKEEFLVDGGGVTVIIYC